MTEKLRAGRVFLPIWTAAMMTCCLETIREYRRPEGTEHEGTLIYCDCCRAPLRIRDGAWEWSGDDLPTTTSNTRLDTAGDANAA